MEILIAVVILLGIFEFTNRLSYRYFKNKTLKERKWDLNICCGKTDGGGINADIFKHESVPNFLYVSDIYNLPFEDGQFEHVLCSHTLEHVEDPELFYNELKRVGKHVILLLPPLWDITAVLNFFEHRWIFLCSRTRYDYLPKYIELPFSRQIQKKRGQTISA